MTVPFMSEDDSLGLPTAPFDPESQIALMNKHARPSRSEEFV